MSPRFSSFRLPWLLLAITLFTGLRAAEEPAATPARPIIWGIARTTYWVSDLQVAREFYGDYLGFEVAFDYPSDKGTVTVYKVSDRQFIEVLVNPAAKTMRRLVCFSFETADVEGMRQYMASKGVAVPAKVSLDQAGNETFTIEGPDGHNIEFMRFLPGSLHKKSAGKHLPDTRISKRIHHGHDIEAPDLVA